jgi:hypothetical protein
MITKKARLIREYPLKVARLTVGKEYEVLNERCAKKQITHRFSLPIRILSILNDNQQEILVNELFFEIL